MTLRGLNLAVRFLLELGALAALAWWGVELGSSWVGSLVMGIGFPALAAVTWGNFVAPRAPQFLPRPGRLAIEIAVFGTATTGLAAMGHWPAALVFGLAAAGNTALTHIWKQDDAMRANAGGRMRAQA